jgi:coenzyme F420 hydrogenase subunit beta
MGLCPYVKTHKGEIRLIDECNLDRGRCYSYCPRTSFDLEAVSQAVFGVPFRLTELGEVRDVLVARTTDAEIRAKAQYGGVVSTLACFALEDGVIDSAVLTKSENLIPTGVVASNRSEVIGCAGSNFVASPTLEAFNRHAKEDGKRIGFVGVPCQVLALSKRKTVAHDVDRSMDKLALTIGLFCTWALSYKMFYEFLERRCDSSSIKRMDIPPPPANIMVVHTEEDSIESSLDEIRESIMPACNACLDMTSEFADISVGMVEGMENWNTVLVRTEQGQKLIERAEKAGVIETGPLASDSLEHLRRASLLKKKRAMREIMARTGSKRDALYLEMRAEDIDSLLSD